MSTSERFNQVAPYLERALESDYIHARVGEALSNARRAYARGSRESAKQAAEDKQLQRYVRSAARSLRAAGAELAGRRTKAKRRRRRRVALVAAVGGGLAALAGATVRARLAAQAANEPPPTGA